jgi:FKBP-type peptidyl-prolyl cis-trans isomerase FkpA
MAEVTRVPIQPIRKGSLTKLWIGIAVVLVAALALAWWTIPRSVGLEEVTAGTGASPGENDVAFIHYVGKLPDGTVFDQSQDVPLPVEGIFPEGTPMPLEEGATIPGFRAGLLQMQKGGKYELTIPADQAYGASPPPGSPIPANSDLVFEVELVDFMSREDFERRVQAIQQMMQMQQGAQGAPGAPGSPAPQPGQ